jgi:hypothetical protein
METYNHIKTVLGIILGLSITHSLKGAVKLIEHPGKVKIYSVHLLWALYMFLSTVYFWWFEIHLAEVEHWTFIKYFFLVIYVTLYYVMSALLFPDDMKDYDSYESYYYSRKKWFFSFLGLLFVFDFFDTLLKGQAYMQHLQWEYPLRIGTHITLCIAAAMSSNKIFHLFLVLGFIIFQILWILTFYFNG